jgi:two-component system LytT family sensor kinase
MNNAKPSRVKRLSFWISMPFITLALLSVMYGSRLFEDWRVAAAGYPIIYLLGYCSWRVHAGYDALLRRRYPGLEDTKKRVLLKLLVNGLIMTPSVLLILWLFDSLQILGYQIQEGDLRYAYLVGLAVNIIFETLWEVVYLVDKYKESALEKELLERLQLLQEFENLKRKVNPHFLFNCFNTLLALIQEDRKRAEAFLDELSKVYRYLLRSNENGMSTVKQEIDFIRSYASLLHTRYGDGFSLQVSIDPSLHQYELPALSLQLLVENAVKHNILSKEKPVLIRIYTSPDLRLIVENTLAPKTTRGESTGIGLPNIREKYRLLHRTDMEVRSTPELFIVSLPLLQREQRVSGQEAWPSGTAGDF